ncbi:type II secretion system F family protein [Actinoalloteichus caeruleus]|uniref:type II secretion system F family protein n=1 Tax=Actinoalloteichus cyanogriseus TaxID=2893586 RepID=UPI003AAA7F00
MTVLSALLGVAAGLGMVLLLTGWRGTDSPRRGPATKSLDIKGSVLRRLAVAVGAGLVAAVSTGWFAAGLLAGLAGWVLPGLLGGGARRQQRVARIEGIATWAEMLRDTLSAAAGLEQAILATADLAPLPVRREIGRLADRLRAGDRLAPALRLLAEELGDPTADLVVASLISASRQQTRRLGELLGSLATAARDQVSLRLRIEAGRARTRTSVRVIVGTTLGFALGLVALNRDYLTAYDTTSGQLVLLGIGGLFSVGFLWLARIATLVEPARVLTRTNQHETTDAPAVAS